MTGELLGLGGFAAHGSPIFSPFLQNERSWEDVDGICVVRTGKANEEVDDNRAILLAGLVVS
jgi:hypothetical protein